jgi:hypothetical protein
MEPTMYRPSLNNVSLASPANDTRNTQQLLARASTATMAALVLAACAFIPTRPAAAATSNSTSYCLSSDSENDCSFASLAQCEATASGGLGVCGRVAAWSSDRGPYAMSRALKAHRTRG